MPFGMLFLFTGIFLKFGYFSNYIPSYILKMHAPGPNMGMPFLWPPFHSTATKEKTNAVKKVVCFCEWVGEWRRALILNDTQKNHLPVRENYCKGQFHNVKKSNAQCVPNVPSCKGPSKVFQCPCTKNLYLSF